MKLLARALEMARRDLHPVYVADAYHLQELRADVMQKPGEMTFDEIASRLLGIIMSPTLPQSPSVHDHLRTAAAFAMIEHARAGLPLADLGPATRAYVDMLCSYVDEADMPAVTLEELMRLDYSAPTSRQDTLGQRLSGRGFTFPTPAGFYVIDHVLNPFTEARHVDVTFIPALPGDLPAQTTFPSPLNATPWIRDHLSSTIAFRQATQVSA